MIAQLHQTMARLFEARDAELRAWQPPVYGEGEMWVWAETNDNGLVGWIMAPAGEILNHRGVLAGRFVRQNGNFGFHAVGVKKGKPIPNHTWIQLRLQLLNTGSSYGRLAEGELTQALRTNC